MTDIRRFWNTTAAERAATYPCEAHAEAPYELYLRAVDVAAPARITFRWLCQLKVAPYSYDWIDNFGRRSPERLTPGADRLEIGQEFMIGRILEFEPGRHLTGSSSPGATRLFGPITLTYQVNPVDAGSSRIVVAMCITARSPLGRLRRWLLGWGDLVMMRGQLLTLKRHAEKQAAAEQPAAT